MTAKQKISGHLHRTRSLTLGCIPLLLQENMPSKYVKTHSRSTSPRFPAFNLTLWVAFVWFGPGWVGLGWVGLGWVILACHQRTQVTTVTKTHRRCEFPLNSLELQREKQYSQNVTTNITASAEHSRPSR